MDRGSAVNPMCSLTGPPVGECVALRIWGSGLRVLDFRVWGFWFRVGCRVWDLGFGVLGFTLF